MNIKLEILTFSGYKHKKMLSTNHACKSLQFKYLLMSSVFPKATCNIFTFLVCKNKKV